MCSITEVQGKELEIFILGIKLEDNRLSRAVCFMGKNTLYKNRIYDTPKGILFLVLLLLLLN